MSKEAKWDRVIESETNYFKLGIKDIWRYRDLLVLLVKRDIIAFYKQTVLGPIWLFIQPLFTMAVYVFIFGNLAGLPTAGLPKPIFYLSGITFWTYFSQTLTKTSTVLRDNQNILGKVYFPRVIMPLSRVVSNMVRMFIQIALLFVVTIYFVTQGFIWQPSLNLLLMPLLIVLLALQALGFGMLVSALTTKYRDLALLLTFGVQLLMYATPVVYPLDSLSGTMLRVVQLNPITALFEGFRYSMFGQGQFGFESLLISILITSMVLLSGLYIFNKVEKSFVDTV